MKKKYLYFGIIFFLFCLFLTSCNKTKDDNEDKKEDKIEDTLEDVIYNDESRTKEVALSNNYDLVVGDKVNPIIKTRRDRFTYKTTDKEIFSVDKEGNIVALKKGKAKLKVYELLNLQAIIKINVSDKIEINYNCDDKSLKEFNEEFKKYESKNDLTLNTMIEIDNQALEKTTNQEVVTKIKKNPFYMELDTKMPTYPYRTHSIVKYNEDNKKYYSYDVDDEKKYITKTCLGSANTFTSDYSDLTDYSSYLDFDYKKLELNKKKDNKYELKLNVLDNLDLIKDLIDKDTKDLLDQSDMIMVLNFTFNENSFVVKYEINIHLIISDIVINAPVKMRMEFSFDEIKELNYDEYNISKPKTIDECEELDNLYSFNVIGYEKACIYNHMEKGRYALFASPKSDSSYISYKIYDENKNLLDISDIKKTTYFDNSFTINEDGNYYFEIKWGLSGDNTISFEKLDYPLNEEKELTSDKGHIKDRYDYYKYTYNSKDENELLKITNNSSENLYLLIKNAKSNVWGEGYIKLKANESCHIDPEENSIIYVVPAVYDHSHDENFDFSYDYDFTVEKVDASQGRTDELDYIESDYNKTYYVGYNLSEIHLKLDAKEDGLYRFYRRSVGSQYEDSTYFSIEENTYSYEFKLEKGEYEIIANAPYQFDIYQYRYEFISLAEMNVDITLPVIDTLEYMSPAYVDNQKIHIDQILKYHFTLEEDSIILIDSKYVELYDELNNPVCFKSKYLMNCLVRLKKGSYYAMTPKLKQDFILAIYNGEADYAIDKDLNELELDKKYIISYEEQGMKYYTKCLKYEAKESFNMKSKFCFINVEVFDENLNYIAYDDYFSGGNKFNVAIEEGKTYYFVITVPGRDRYDEVEIKFFKEEA